MSKNGWNDWTFNSIGWKAHTQAVSTLLEYTSETTLRYQLGPQPATNMQAHKRIGLAKLDLFPSYIETIENAPDIFVCERRIQWQDLS